MSNDLPASGAHSPFISAEILAVALASGSVAVVYVAPDASPLPAAAIPGSIETALPTHYAEPGDPGLGRLPLPSSEAVRRWTAEAGLSQDTDIVVYDAASGSRVVGADLGRTARCPHPGWWPGGLDRPWRRRGAVSRPGDPA